MARLVIHYAALKAALAPHLRQGLDKVGGAIEGDASAGAPRRTGTLAGSVTHEVIGDGGGVFVRVSATAPYAFYVETGTSDTRAQPFLRSAALKQRGTL